MFCKQCGTQLEEGMTFCTNCGAKQVDEQAIIIDPVGQQVQQGYTNQVCTQTNYYAGPNMEVAPASVTFREAIKLYFTNYANFTGRATKSEYWWAFLFNFLVSIATSWIPGVGQIISLGLLIPGLSIGIRRLHDTGKSWTYILMGLIPLAGFIILIVQYCKDSDGDNQWGSVPTYK